MIFVGIFLYLSVLVDDNGHETLAAFGYIISALCTLFWLIGVMFGDKE